MKNNNNEELSISNFDILVETSLDLIENKYITLFKEYITFFERLEEEYFEEFDKYSLPYSINCSIRK